ncbi:MAG TPA: ATP-binding protein [Candidatus Polarisedimenticolaceae bacterium]|nr:ATP-binding protein [Candidatus Polarisedimenticolaceae bacterium]
MSEDSRPVIRVLLVDDDEDDALLTRGLLAEATQVAFELEWARTFEDGLERLRQGGYDVALVDWRLGTHDGIDLIRLAAESGWPAPIILLTGRGGHAVDLAAMDAGAADFLSKNHLTTDVLDRALRYAVQHRRMEEARVRLAAERSAREQAEAHSARLRVSEARLKATVAELARSNAELEQFAYVSSHDLQEPLRTISTFTELLGRKFDGRLDDETREYLGFVQAGVRRMHDLITALLTYSLVSVPSEPPAEIELEEVFDATLQQMRAAVEAAGATITRGPLPRLEADPVQIGQLFQNLLANALKFAGGRTPEVRVEARPTERGQWHFSVQDNGIGIPPEHRRRIFLLFKRLHQGSDYPGTGLGLAICKKIVERHGGRIWVESSPGGGSTFHFVLPATQGRSLEQGQQVLPRERRATPRPLERRGG